MNQPDAWINLLNDFDLLAWHSQLTNQELSFGLRCVLDRMWEVQTRLRSLSFGNCGDCVIINRYKVVALVKSYMQSTMRVRSHDLDCGGMLRWKVVPVQFKVVKVSQAVPMTSFISAQADFEMSRLSLVHATDDHKRAICVQSLIPR